MSQTMFTKADVSLVGEGGVRVRRSFKAPQAALWRAHTEPALVSRWMLGPPGWTMPVCEMDVRVGGAYRWRWRSQGDGKEFGFFGTFLEVEAPRLIAHEQFFDPGDVGGDMGAGARVSMTLAGQGDMTLLETVIDFGTAKAREAAMATGMTDGMEMSFVQLDKVLAEPAQS